MSFLAKTANGKESTRPRSEHPPKGRTKEKAGKGGCNRSQQRRKPEGYQRLKEWDRQGTDDDSEGKYGAGVGRDCFGRGWL